MQFCSVKVGEVKYLWKILEVKDWRRLVFGGIQYYLIWLSSSECVSYTGQYDTACINYCFVGTSKYSTPSSLQTPPMFVNFGCNANYHNNLSDCDRPSGVTTNLVRTSCAPGNVLGILCARELLA